LNAIARPAQNREVRYTQTWVRIITVSRICVTQGKGQWSVLLNKETCAPAKNNIPVQSSKIFRNIYPFYGANLPVGAVLEIFAV
jgi:hypothetical protein